MLLLLLRNHWSLHCSKEPFFEPFTNVIEIFDSQNIFLMFSKYCFKQTYFIYFLILLVNQLRQTNLFIFPKLIKVCKIRLAITGERGKQIFLLCFRKCLIPETLLSIKIYCFHTATQQRWKKYYRKSTLHFSNQTLKSFTNNFFHLYCLFES